MSLLSGKNEWKKKMNNLQSYEVEEENPGILNLLGQFGDI